MDEGSCKIHVGVGHGSSILPSPEPEFCYEHIEKTGSEYLS